MAKVLVMLKGDFSTPSAVKPPQAPRNTCYLLQSRLDNRSTWDNRQLGITIVEALIAMVVLAVTGAAALLTYNTIANFLYRTDRVSRINAIIDNDLSRIREISQEYNACATPGTIDTTNCAAEVGGELNTYNYFPVEPSDVSLFQQSCRDPDPDKHITKNFIDLIDSPHPISLGGDPISSSINKSVAREPGASPDNYNVVVSYSAPFGIRREAILTPFLSYWCPS